MQIEDNSFENIKKSDTPEEEDGCKYYDNTQDDKDPLPPSRIEINRPPVKKKKRFIYYGLSIFFSFIVARLALIAISLYSLNFDKLILNNMKYDSANYDSFTLDVSLSDTYSPLFIRIKDIDCDVFGVNKNNGLCRFFSLDVPDIEIIKYKTLRFIHDIKFKNINPKDILESNNTKAIKVKIRGKLCYRFCLMKFYLRFDLEKEIEIKNKENKVKWPIINNLDIKKKEDAIILNLNIDNSNFRLPYYVNITLAESLIKCSQDFSLYS
ncbi:hypothetical protein NBO_398g0004 [Nosema bombycis CQ1]|uniref:Uncharacterized protein n=1 Tax=Nosema bombycis (strain CQ1 / CVCC 102059) TaxID=578461 RepID=R0KPH5_NOSB1|nr:hypothetical protein NBO_398g0004 [Nosema bombycis CQ1]|eukprot:EOB12606.1 hypothetical protein NBO_398g0004 [Nosema bombycis CQ1]